MTSGFKPGEIVDIAIKGVRVDAENADGTVTVVAEHSDGGPAHWQMPPQAEVTRVAPANWPPQGGDTWIAEHGARYFAYSGKGGEMRFMIGSGANWEVGHLHSIYPVRLLERPDRPYLLPCNKQDGSDA